MRAIFEIKSFRFQLRARPPREARNSDLPIVELHLLKWDVVTGDRSEPVFWENAAEVGFGKGDGEVQRVLAKWWMGE